MECYNLSINDSERNSFPVCVETEQQMMGSSKNRTTFMRPQMKKVRFSEMSSMICYELRESEDSTAFFYSNEDCEQMKADSYKAALAILTIIESSSSFQAAQASNHTKSLLIKRYTQDSSLHCLTIPPQNTLH